MISLTVRVIVRSTPNRRLGIPPTAISCKASTQYHRSSAAFSAHEPMQRSSSEWGRSDPCVDALHHTGMIGHRGLNVKGAELALADDFLAIDEGIIHPERTAH